MSSVCPPVRAGLECGMSPGAAEIQFAHTGPDGPSLRAPPGDACGAGPDLIGERLDAGRCRSAGRVRQPVWVPTFTTTVGAASENGCFRA